MKTPLRVAFALLSSMLLATTSRALSQSPIEVDEGPALLVACISVLGSLVLAIECGVSLSLVRPLPGDVVGRPYRLPPEGPSEERWQRIFPTFATVTRLGSWLVLLTFGALVARDAYLVRTERLALRSWTGPTRIRALATVPWAVHLTPAELACARLVYGHACIEAPDIRCIRHAPQRPVFCHNGELVADEYCPVLHTCRWGETSDDLEQLCTVQAPSYGPTPNEL
jgi:hypothetical protein